LTRRRRSFGAIVCIFVLPLLWTIYLAFTCTYPSPFRGTIACLSSDVEKQVSIHEAHYHGTITKQAKLLFTNTSQKTDTLQVIRYSSIFLGGDYKSTSFVVFSLTLRAITHCWGVMIWIVGILLPKTTSTSIPEFSDLSTITSLSNIAFLSISSNHMIK
jgi:hypothetical protein